MAPHRRHPVTNPHELIAHAFALPTRMNDWTDLTRFGDVTITTLLATAIAAWLFAEDEKRLALWWTLLYGGAMGVVIATKMAFIGWGIGIRALDFAGFSGHAMRAAAVMPVLCYLILQRA